MRIAHVVPSSGGAFYCENCIRDTVLIKGLKDLGCGVAIIPMYLPFVPDERGMEGDTPVVYGALNVFLRHKLPLYRHAPGWVEHIFDSRGVLDFVARRAGSTRAPAAGEITVSVLRGEDGGQAGELAKLVRLLGNDVKPDAVHLSNALLIGLARPIKRALRVPVLCSLQDEHTWIDAMGETHAREAWRVLAEQSAHVDLFVTFSRYYARFMKEHLGLPSKKLSVVPMGIDTDGREQSPLPFDPPVIGFLSRMCESSGLGTLTDAFIKLKKEKGFEGARLHVAGGYTGDDRHFLRKVRGKLKDDGCAADVKFLTGFDKASRRDFLQTLTAFSVPSREAPAYGMYLLEAFAAGVPVVQPGIGAYPEVVNATGGGILYDPNTADALAEALASLLREPARARALGRKGRAAVLRRFRIEDTAKRVMRLYEKCKRM
jgi:glycosyltransferase involved in cell wall biosynthesis